MKTTRGVKRRQVMMTAKWDVNVWLRTHVLNQLVLLFEVITLFVCVLCFFSLCDTQIIFGFVQNIDRVTIIDLTMTFLHIWLFLHISSFFTNGTQIKMWINRDININVPLNFTVYIIFIGVTQFAWVIADNLYCILQKKVVENVSFKMSVLLMRHRKLFWFTCVIRTFCYPQKRH